jgi:hypothetical protein
MHNLKQLRISLAILMLAGAQQLGASSWDKYTVMSTTEPILIGGKILHPGTYVWKLLDSTLDRNIVQVSDKKTGHVETTIVAIPNYRQQVSDNISFQFWESPTGLPKPVRSWFYPGDNVGQEFAYPEALMASLAKAQPVLPPVLAAPLPAALQPVFKRVGIRRLAVASSAAAPHHQNTPASGGSWAVATGGGEPIQKKAGTPMTNSTIWDHLKALPLTATFAPLVGLIGLGSLMLGLMTYLKRRNQRIAH